MERPYLFALALLVLLMLPRAGHAQYWGERVLEKSFEQTDFFFTPSYLNPLGLGTFGSSAPGLVDDPLLNLQVNPAFLTADTLAAHYGYLDFRNTREVRQEPVYYYDDYALRSTADAGADFIARDAIYYPSYYARARTILEPVFSGAYLYRPGGRAAGPTIGATYQLLLQDERYYSIPVGLYRAHMGYSFTGERMAAADALPVVDRYDGADRMRQRGHLLNVVAGYPLTARLDLGLRLGRTRFERDGAFGVTNLWAYTPRQDAYWHNREEREQTYDHWDLSAGLRYRLAAGWQAGLTAGYLTGTAAQTLASRDTSFYRTGVEHGTNWSRYVRSGFSDQQWDHDGATFYGGADLTARLDPRRLVTFYYRLAREDVDLAVGSQVVDTSYSRSSYTATDYRSEYTSYYALRDLRRGTGRRAGWTHHVAAAFRWQLDAHTRVHLGANLLLHHRQVETEEDVQAWRNNFWTSEWNGGTNLEQSTVDEAKTLHWTFDARTTGLQIPLLVTHRFSRAFELLAGLNRRMMSRDLTDVTLAVFDHRTTTEAGQTVRRKDFGERYTEPEETVSDIQTTVLAGVTVTPATGFDIRLLVVPHFADTYGGTTLRAFQWWISFNLTPGI